MAWFVDTYKGFDTIEHGRGQLAVRSLVAMIPSKKLVLPYCLILTVMCIIQSVVKYLILYWSFEKSTRWLEVLGHKKTP
ncbi:hypothetical protein [Brevibacillus sp. SIMBA_076]|uniref:hypothetical protein n=1 Tax=Brevibacillus sp. SIMBA_076 TaxID=3085814 RepID=UPI00397E0265